MGGCPPGSLREQRPVIAISCALFVSKPASVARPGNSRLCVGELCARTPGARRRYGPDEAHQGGLCLRARCDRCIDHAADVVRAAARGVPGLLAYHDFWYALARPAECLCQRLFANRAA